MADIAAILRSVLDRIGQFFDVLDLSFFICGIAAFAALDYWLKSQNIPFELPLLAENAGLVAVVVGTYILGLICFAVGRSMRTVFGTQFRRGADTSVNKIDKSFFENLTFYNQAVPWDKPVQQFLSSAGLGDEKRRGFLIEQSGRLYTYLWAQLRQIDALAPSFTLIRRYWVLSATYDGLGAAFTLWVLVIVHTSCFPISLDAICTAPSQTFPPILTSLFPALRPAGSMLPAVAVLLFAVYFCFREAGRYKYFQQVEIVATLAYYRQEMQPNLKPPTTETTTADHIPG